MAFSFSKNTVIYKEVYILYLTLNKTVTDGEM